MDGMFGTQLIKITAPDKPKIPEALIQATIDTIKAGIRLDETVLEEQAAKAKEKATKEKRRIDRFIKKEESEDEFVERTYRAHEDRRFGFLIIGDQHRISNKAGYENHVNDAAPLDFSFCLLNTVEEIITEQEEPQTRRNYKQPMKTDDDRYITASLRLSYNVLKNFEGLINVLYKILDDGPFGLRWLDLSFNRINSLDEDTLSQLPNLKILYLHGNAIEDMTEIPKLACLTQLQHLTLHGNPIEQDDMYRISVLYFLRDLDMLHLDFIGITKGDRVAANRFGIATVPIWAKKHVELEAKAAWQKENQDKSLTVRLLKAESETDSD